MPGIKLLIFSYITGPRKQEMQHFNYIFLVILAFISWLQLKKGFLFKLPHLLPMHPFSIPLKTLIFPGGGG